MKNKKVCTFFFLALILICFSIKTYGFGEKVDYIIGVDRYETSALLSKANYEDSPYAIIASGESYIDALTSSPLAFNKKAPILLTNKNKLNEFTKKLIDKYGINNGGQSVDLKEMTFEDENEKVKIKFLFSHISGSKDSSTGKIESHGNDFYILLKLK